MASVTVTINGRSFQINCGDGQEGHVARMARILDQHVQRVVANVGGTVNESTLLVMAGILLAEEAAEARGELERLRGAMAGRSGLDESIAADLERLAERVVAIARHLETS